MPLDLDNIPEGTSINRKNGTVIIDILLRDNLLKNLFLGLTVIAVMLFILRVIIPQTQQGEMSVLFGGFIISFCLFIITFFTIRVFMSLFGRIEIRLEERQGTVFHGIKNIGRRHTFIYKDTHTIDRYTAESSHKVPTQFGILIKEKKRIFFGGYLKEEKVNFIVKMLQLFLKDGKKIRDLLPPDLIHNLID